MKVRSKLLISFSSVLGLLVVAASYAAHQSQMIDQDREVAFESQEQILDLTNLRAEVRNYLLLHFRLNSSRDLLAGKSELVSAVESIHSKLSQLENTSIRSAFFELEKALKVSQSDLRQGNVAKFREELAVIQKKQFVEGFLQPLNSAIQLKVAESHLKNEILKSRTAYLRIAGWIFALLALMLSVYYAFSLARALGQRLEKLEEATREISGGNFDIALPLEGSDEFAALSKAFNKMANSLSEAQAQLLAQQEIVVATSKMSALGEMAGGIAHEINNPLATIQLLADQLRESQRFDHSKVSETARRIQATVERIALIIKGLRTFVRDAENDPFEAVAIQEVIHDTLRFCEQRIKAKQIRLTVELPQEPLVLECRAAQISQVLLNLISNAHDAVEDCPAKWIRIRVQDQGNSISVQITDSGAGVPDSVREKIMMPFFTTKAVGKGTGLGLSISRNIVDSHHGVLQLDATQLQTTFVITLPKKQNADLKSA